MSFKTKVVTLSAACALHLTLLSACSQPAAEQADQPVASDNLQPVSIERRESASSHEAVKAAAAAIRSEPRVIDLVYDPQAMVQWTIGVKDDGSPRFGYAEYICGTLADLGALSQGTHVRIVNYQAFMNNGGDAHAASLGHVDCDGLRHLMP